MLFHRLHYGNSVLPLILNSVVNTNNIHEGNHNSTETQMSNCHQYLFELGALLFLAYQIFT